MTYNQKSNQGIKRLVVLVGFELILAGCASPDVNPPQARPNMGYVDFHAASPGQFTWQVSRFDAGTKDYQQIYSCFDPPGEGIVRLALAPGQYRLRVELLNRLTTGPLDVELRVEDGQITPVRLTVARVGTGDVETVETNVGGTLYGRYGRNTTISDDAEARYKIGGTVQETVAYRPKGEMPYAQSRSQ
jgi:hypothetical protein